MPNRVSSATAMLAVPLVIRGTVCPLAFYLVSRLLRWSKKLNFTLPSASARPPYLPFLAFCFLYLSSLSPQSRPYSPTSRPIRSLASSPNTFTPRASKTAPGPVAEKVSPRFSLFFAISVSLNFTFLLTILFLTNSGCTSAAIRCHQIKVNYSRLTYEEYVTKPPNTVTWDVADTKFFVNTEGCGYPPRVNCSVFAKKYGRTNMGKIFPCYYSRTYPHTVVARYKKTHTRALLFLFKVSLFFGIFFLFENVGVSETLHS